MNHFSWMDFVNFTEEVKYSTRFIYSDKTEDFLRAIKDSLPTRVKPFPKGEVLFRSQLGFNEHYEEGCYYPAAYLEERMKPIRGKAKEGRANSKGIPVLYLSSDADTSMAELRPQVGQDISCGQFQTNQALKLVDCCSTKNKYTRAQIAFGTPKNIEEWEDGIWFQINEAFSQPVINEPNNAAYIPTQILSELFKHSGLDGLFCKSHLGIGNNFILFQPFRANMIACEIRTTKSVSFEFEMFDRESRW
ncbi:MAG: RES family NAD+ phosphorylase [Legionella sp.]|uniref:RES family NAD+ phosphorylase n=1 Tax=Legionella sp. TaxID=459 RepID=UPI0028428B2B|nr:RES family NAD+ phosphorylase [Legionella sp.]